MRIEVKYDLSGYTEEIQRRLKAGVRAGLHAAGQDAVAQIQRTITETEPRPPVDTGLLRNSITSTVDADGLGATIGPAPPAAARGAVMELGRRPGQRRPPVDVIARWVQRKGLVAGFSGQGRRRRVKNEEKKALGIAFAIARSIQKKGIKARGFMRRALPVIKARLPDFLRMGVEKALQGPPPPPGAGV